MLTQILYEFLDAFQKQSRPVEQLVQAASLLILPMLEAGYDAGENIVDEESLTTIVNSMFDQQDGASSMPMLLTRRFVSVRLVCTCRKVIASLLSKIWQSCWHAVLLQRLATAKH